jgi:hypothetical protein
MTNLAENVAKFNRGGDRPGLLVWLGRVAMLVEQVSNSAQGAQKQFPTLSDQICLTRVYDSDTVLWTGW